ncbi:MAG: Flp family type IVb pilin [Elusimicrobia bacterium]|nr:Flp family type IVb pilin [Elusimicrobiota bacterium]
MFNDFLKNEDAQGMTEYILIIALIAVVCVAAIKMFGREIQELIEKSTDKIKRETRDFSR